MRNEIERKRSCEMITQANLSWLLFDGPFSPWRDYYTLKERYKDPVALFALSQELDRTILWLGVGNLLLSPVVFLYQILK